MLIRLTNEEFELIKNKWSFIFEEGDNGITCKHDKTVSNRLDSRVLDDRVGIYHLDYRHDIDEDTEKEEEFWTLKLDISNATVELGKEAERFIDDLMWIVTGRDDNEGSWLQSGWYRCEFFINMLEEQGILKDYIYDGCSYGIFGYLADGVTENKLNEVLSFDSVYAYLLEKGVFKWL